MLRDRDPATARSPTNLDHPIPQRRPPLTSFQPQATQHRRMTIRIGISGWRYGPWRGVFYPKELPQRRELAFGTGERNGVGVATRIDGPPPPPRQREACCYFDNDATRHAPFDALALIARLDCRRARQRRDRSANRKRRSGAIKKNGRESPRSRFTPCWPRERLADESVDQRLGRAIVGVQAAVAAHRVQRRPRADGLALLAL